MNAWKSGSLLCSDGRKDGQRRSSPKNNSKVNQNNSTLLQLSRDYSTSSRGLSEKAVAVNSNSDSKYGSEAAAQFRDGRPPQWHHARWMPHWYDGRETWWRGWSGNSNSRMHACGVEDEKCVAVVVREGRKFGGGQVDSARNGGDGMSWSWNVRWGDADFVVEIDILIYVKTDVGDEGEVKVYT